MVYKLILLHLFSLVAVSKAECDSKWKKVLETDKNGNVLYGQKQDLVDAVLQGSEVRFSSFSDGYITGINSASVVGNENVCVQALFHISKSGDFDFQSNAYWWFLNVCTTGFMHMSRWYVGEHRSAGSTKTKYGAKWFVRDLQCSSSPVFCNTMTGIRTCGNLDTLTTAVINGADVKAVDASRAYVQGFTNLVVYNEGSYLAGQYPWHVSQSIVGDHIEFQNDAYWWATILSNSGTREMSRWNVGEHKSRGHSTDKIPMNWFADTCWTLAYSHDSYGNQMDGSLDFLRGAILSGRRVKVVTGNYSIEADNLYVSNSGHVSAQLLGHLSKATESSFQSDVYWYWQHASTSGNVETVRYSIGSTNNEGNSSDIKAMKWFIDTRRWHHVLSTNKTGSPMSGSKSNLIDAVKSGSMLRYVIHLPDNNFRVLNADNIAIKDQNVAAQSVRSVSDKPQVGNVPREFETEPHWHFTITATNGRQKSVWWRVGQHTSRPATESTNVVDWFVN